MERGHARFELNGEKLKGGYALIRLPRGNWLLVKLADEYADPADDLLSRRPESVLSRRRIEDFER